MTTTGVFKDKGLGSAKFLRLDIAGMSHAEQESHGLCMYKRLNGGNTIKTLQKCFNNK
jgi:hypothetical protein